MSLLPQIYHHFLLHIPALTIQVPIIHYLLPFLMLQSLYQLHQMILHHHYHLHFLLLLWLISIQCKLGPRVVLSSLNFAIRPSWITLKLNLLLIEWLQNILCGVLLWMQNFRPYKGNRPGHWFLHLLMPIW